jgi:predicted hydrocarbon binding protein
MKKREFPYYHGRGKKLFQIVVKLHDSPGSLSSLLDLLSPKVNFVGISTYTMNDGTAIVSAFAEGLSEAESAKSLSETLGRSRTILDSDVREGSGDILVDTFHTGPRVEGKDFLLISRDSLCSVFNQLTRLMGSGGEALLYTEGKSMGVHSAQEMLNLLGPKEMSEKATYLRKVLSAHGFGNLQAGEATGEGIFQVKVTECFECAVNDGSRKGCNFMRGYLEGSMSLTYGTPLTSTETKCVFEGDDCCEFLLAPSKS